MLARRALLLSIATALVPARPAAPAKSSMEFKSAPGECAAPGALRKSWELRRAAYDARALRANAASAFYEALSIGDLAEAKSALRILRDIEDSEGPDATPPIDVDDMGAEANLARLLSACYEV